MAVAQLIDDIAPELSATESERKNRIITVAQGQLSPSVFGPQYDYAVALLAAHMLTVANRRGSSGAVNSVSEGSLSMGFGRVNPMGKSQWETTAYGAELRALIKRTVISARTSHV